VNNDKEELFQMAENICLMLSTECEFVYPLTRAIDLAVAAVDLHKRTVLYVDEQWKRYVKAGELENRSDTRESAVKLRSFLKAGGQLWVTPSARSPLPSKIEKLPLIEGAIVVDDETLMTFLTQNTLVLTF
jgi:hypothetical protein